MRYSNFLVIVFLFLFSSCEQEKVRDIPNRMGVVADNAMVVSAHPLASQVGLAVLRDGGNAIDAAVAVHFALSVVYPSAGNIGGGGFLIYRTNNGEFYSLDYREKAPLSAGRDMYLDSIGDVDNKVSRLGHLACGVPGSVDGMETAHQRFGSISWDELLTPSVELAKNGFILTEKEASKLAGSIERIQEYSTVTPENLIRKSWKKGDTISYDDLSKTLKRIAEHGAAGFYEGETARLIVEEMERGNGLISYEDLANYNSVWRDPIQFGYKEYNITSMGPPSSGGVALAQLFTMMDLFPINEWGIDHMKTIHAIVESEKLVFADRAKYLGDPDFTQVPVDALMDLKYNMARASTLDFERSKSADDIMPGSIIKEHEETTHFSIIDQYGNAVSSTTTLNGGFGNHVVVGKAGFFLNNEMDDFSSKPGAPNMYGLIGGEANAIVPAKRMLSSMTPTIVEKNGDLFMVVGTPGGSTIITSVFQAILNVVDFGLNMQGSVDYPRFHHQWRPDVIQYEPGRFEEYLLDELDRLGHKVNKRSAIGRVDAILVLEDGRFEGGADERGDDMAVGF